MAEKILNTRIVLRNDSSANWLTNKDQILLKGEVGIEFLADGKVKMKVGDGTKTWEQLSYFGGESAHVIEPEVLAAGADHIAAIQTAAADIELAVGDIAIIRETISGNKVAHTAYVYTGTEWKAMDGNVKAENVYFSEDLLTTAAIGNITLSGGQATISAAGQNLLDVWQNIFVKEDKTGLKKSSPSASITASDVTYIEVGSSSSKDVTITYSDGEYKYGYTTETGSESDAATASSIVNNKTTGANATAYNLTVGGSKVDPKTTGGNVFSVDSGIKTEKASLSTGSATVSYDEGYIPVSNLKKMYPSQAIAASTATATNKELFRWYVPMFHGFKTKDTAIAAPASISADEVKGLSTKITGATAYDLTVPVEASTSASWKQYFVAIPKSTGKSKPSIVDDNGLPLDVAAAGNVTITFGTASIEYNVWYVDLADSYDTLKIKLAW